VQDVKRIEIVVGSQVASALLDELDRLGIRDHTAVNGVSGRGARGERGGDPFSGAFDNTYVLIAVDPAEVDRVVEAVRPVLRRHGGMCLVSDARWVRHEAGDHAAG
jgi:nitrogen regulatory protein PII